MCVADSDNSDVEDFDSETRRMIKKKRKRFITSHLVNTLDGTGVSDRQAVRIISAVVQALDFKLDELVISRSTIRRIRIKNRENTAKIMMEKIEVNFKIKI